MERDELFDTEKWFDNSKRKATALNLGMRHPNPGQIYYHLLVELASKFLLPVISFVVTQPLLQMTLSSALMLALYIEAVTKPAYIDRMFCAGVEGCRLVSLCAMLCGLTTVIINDEDSYIPLVLLIT